MVKTMQCGGVIVFGILVGAASVGCAVDEPDDLGSVEDAVLVRCPGPSVAFKANPQPDECQSPSIASVRAFDFNFAPADVASGNTTVYFFDAGNGFFPIPPPTLAQASSFHTEWDATHIIRGYYANAAGGTEVFTVPATMVGVHHASTNNSDPSANWSNGHASEAIAIARMHTCTYLRTR